MILITEKNNTISGRVASRYYHVYGSENFQEGYVIGTPSQVDKFFKNIGENLFFPISIP